MPPTNAGQERSLPPPPSEASPDLFDYALVRDYAMLLLTSPRRRLRQFAITFFSVLIISLIALFTLPKTYTAEVSILTQQGARQKLLGVLPLQGAAETIMSQANLEALVLQTHLVENFEKTRAPLPKLKDYITGKLFGHASEEDLRDGLAATLEKKIRVTVAGEVLTIDATWQDRNTAYALATAVQQNFLAGKEASEVSDLRQTLTILSAHAASVRGEVDEELERLRVTLASAKAKQKDNPKKIVTAAAPTVSSKMMNDSRINSLEGTLQGKRREIEAIEDARNKQMDKVRAELVELRKSYTERHPAVLEAQQRLDALSAEPPELTGLRGDVATLETEITAAGGTVEKAAPQSGIKSLALPREVTAADQMGDPQLDYEASQLRMLISKYNGLLDRIDGARIDMETMQAEFKQRYVVIRPAQVPLKADNLKPPLVIGAGIALGLILALFVSAVLEILGDRVERSWQIERLVGLPVLSQLDKP